LRITPDFYLGIALTVGVIALAGRQLRRWFSRAQSPTNAALLITIVSQQPTRPAHARPTQRSPFGSVPATNRPAPGGPTPSALEGHLRHAIISADARERLVKHAMHTTGGDRAAAIRKVLDDLHAEDRRFS
jgi:hypothetical protein